LEPTAVEAPALSTVEAADAFVPPALTGIEGPALVGVEGPISAGPTAAQRLAQIREEIVAWVKTLFSAAVYAVLIVTFGFQVARVEGQSMAPTLEDQDRLIVNKAIYRIFEP